MAPKKPVKPTKLQVKADQKNKVLTGPKGSKPQSTTTNRVRTQGGTTMSKPKPNTRFQNPSKGGSKTKSQTVGGGGAKPTPKPARPSIGNVRGPARSARPTAPKPSTPSGGGRNLFGGAGDKKAAIAKADGQKAPKPAFRTSRAPLSGNGPFGTRRPARPSLGNVKPGPAAAAAPRQQAQAQGQANVRAAQLRRQQLMAANQRRAVVKGGTGAAIAGAVLNAPAEFKKLQALLRNPKGALSRASSDILSGKPYDPQTVTKASKPATPKPAMPRTVGPIPRRLLEQRGLAAQESKARAKNEARKKSTGSAQATPNTASSFDDAFKDARRAKVSSFTWRGKKYTTKMK